MITRILIVINVIVFLWEVGTGALTSDSALLAHGALTPYSVLHDHQYWRIVTGAFLHASILHIGVNMLSLWFLGRFIEEVLGSPRMLLVYVVSMIVSGLGVVYFSAPYIPTIGASGAIFGLFGALFAIGFKFGRRGMELVKANLGILILNLVLTFSIPEISKAAHVAGLLSGFVLTFAIYFPPKPVRAHVIDAKTGERFESQLETPGDARRQQYP
ncbi:MAG: rhomboid family intramembrane serine protease [Vulcanimicrobiaceae bacterium]